MTRARRVRIFLAHNGICCLCGHQIRDGEAWDIEHPDQLAMGGSDADADLRPVHRGKNCHGAKTAVDAKVRAKRNRVIDKGYVGPGSKKRRMRGGKDDELKRLMNGDVVNRYTGEIIRRGRGK